MTQRFFLFLQGPHGPFFSDLAERLRVAGARVHRIGFNAGDWYYWALKDAYSRNLVSKEDWGVELSRFLDTHAVTDIVMYGDTRGIHKIAKAQAVRRGISVHCFEEGYLRPYWVTYERGGANGHSRLMSLSIADMKDRMTNRRDDVVEAPDQWGALWHHVFYGAVYHFCILFFNRKYPAYAPHRAISIRREWLLHVRRLLSFPFVAVGRRLAVWRLQHHPARYHLVLLQLAHDASFRDHSSFDRIGEFIDLCCKGFAEGAPYPERLVFKAHPLEDGREPLRRLIRQAAQRHGIAGRVHLIHGGRLGAMLDGAATAVTVNSTAGQQALWRGLPLLTFGRSVYDKPELVSRQPIAEFFADPQRPDQEAYMLYREFLLETSQIPGGFYTRAGRDSVLSSIADIMLDRADPYDLAGPPRSARMPQISAKLP